MPLRVMTKVAAEMTIVAKVPAMWTRAIATLTRIANQIWFVEVITVRGVMVTIAALVTHAQKSVAGLNWMVKRVGLVLATPRAPGAILNPG
jgi:hypothetical protein